MMSDSYQANSAPSSRLRTLRVLVACEFSGIVRDAFIAKGHDAWSCDLLPTEKPGNHFQGDVMDVINLGWDLMIAHPPCTYLCRNRARQNREENITPDNSFFLSLWNCSIPKICLENPLPSKMSMLPKYSQIIQPWYFGHDHSKKTCLWLKNLPPLMPTEIVKITYITTANGHRYTKGWYKMPRTSIARSRTFQGIANAMATQWG
jgi:hypothetical protein